MKAVVAAFNQEKALVGAFSVITNLRMNFFEALSTISSGKEADYFYVDMIHWCSRGMGRPVPLLYA